MTTENFSLAKSAADCLLSAMSKLILDEDLTDFRVTCGDKEWKVHSAVLAARSPFFKAAIISNDIKYFDTETMDEVISYMYGKLIVKSPSKFLFEAAERFQMDDLKKNVIELAKKRMNVENVIELGHLAELYNSESFLGECAEFIVENNVETLAFGNKRFKIHSVVLAMRSPFFKTAISNIMNEKLEMKIEIKDLDPETTREVLNFMYGFPIEKSPIKFLLKAAERFQMDDLRVVVVKIAQKRMNVDNVVEFGQLAEMYNIEHFLGDCAEFIVKNDVQMKEKDMKPKLATLVLSNLMDTNRNLNDVNKNLLKELEATKKKLEASENALQNYKDKRPWNKFWQ